MLFKNSTRWGIFTSRFAKNVDIWGIPGGIFPSNTCFHSVLSVFYPSFCSRAKESPATPSFTMSRWMPVGGRMSRVRTIQTVSHSSVKMCSEECRSITPTPPQPLRAVADTSRRALDAQKLLSNLNKEEAVAAAGRTCVTCCRVSALDPRRPSPSLFGFLCLTLDEWHPCQELPSPTISQFRNTTVG